MDLIRFKKNKIIAIISIAIITNLIFSPRITSKEKYPIKEIQEIIDQQNQNDLTSKTLLRSEKKDNKLFLEIYLENKNFKINNNNLEEVFYRLIPRNRSPDCRQGGKILPLFSFEEIQTIDSSKKAIFKYLILEAPKNTPFSLGLFNEKDILPFSLNQNIIVPFQPNYSILTIVFDPSLLEKKGKYLLVLGAFCSDTSYDWIIDSSLNVK